MQKIINNKLTSSFNKIIKKLTLNFLFLFYFSRELSSNNDEEDQKTIEDEISSEINENHQNIESLPTPMDEKSNSTCSDIVMYQENSTNIDHMPSSFISPTKIPLCINDDSKNNKNDNSSEFFYDFKPENFHAEQFH